MVLATPRNNVVKRMINVKYMYVTTSFSLVFPWHVIPIMDSDWKRHQYCWRCDGRLPTSWQQKLKVATLSLNVEKEKIFSSTDKVVCIRRVCRKCLFCLNILPDFYPAETKRMTLVNYFLLRINHSTSPGEDCVHVKPVWAPRTVI